jgi:serine/threonine-protein kinase
MVASAAGPDSFISDTVLAPYERVTAIGVRKSPAWVVRKASPQGRAKLAVAEYFPGVARDGDTLGATFLVEARRLATLAGSNVARVIELAVRGDDVVTFSELVDGESLASTWLTAGIPLEVTLRVVLDVLSAAEAIQAVRDAKQQPMHLAHGELSTSTVVVGVDGIARVLHAVARRLPGATAAHASRGYLAPEVHAGEAYDTRADVFSAGVLLWEALTARRLFEEDDPSAILARMRAGGAPQASPPTRTTWALSLVRIAAKALSPAPADRWQTPAAMAAEIRKAAGLRLAPTTTAAAVARAAFGERAKSRRARWETQVPAVEIADLVPDDAPIEPPAAWAPSLPPREFVSAMATTELDLSATEVSPPPVLESALRASDATLVTAEPAMMLEEPPARPSHESAPYFDAAVDLSIPPPAAPSIDAVDASAAVPALAATVFGDRANQRRMATVLGSVAALGLVVFSMAGWRLAHREGHAVSGVLESSHALAAAPAPSEPTPAPPQDAPSASAVPTDPQSAAAPLATSTPSPPPHPTGPSRAPAAHTPPSPKAKSGPGRKPAAPRPQRAKPKTTHAFDPGSL